MRANFFKCLVAMLLVVATFPVSSAFGAVPLGSAEDVVMYNRNQSVWFMLMLVAFLMLFIRKFEWGVCLGVILTAAASFVTYMALQEFYYGLPSAETWSQTIMIGGVVCAITVVIAIGIFIGTIPMALYLVAGVLFTPAYMFLEYLLVGGGIAGVVDPGGGILVHLFAAYWGIGVALGLQEKRAFNEPMYTSKHSVSFAFLAAMLLFILWPSFVTALSTLEQTTSVMANCYMSGLGAMISAFIACKLMTGKVNPLIYCYAMLAGPVASSSSLLLIGPWESFLIGVIAGVLSAMAFNYLGPWLNKKLGVVDVMGVHQLHGVGGWISLLAGALFVEMYSEGSGMPNIIGGVATLALGIVAGGITGLIMKLMFKKMKDEDLFNDDAEFDGHNPDHQCENKSCPS